MIPELDVSGFTFKTVATDSLSPAERESMRRLFDACYRKANHEHLEKSLARLRFVTYAWQDEQLAGFGIGDSLVSDLPRLPQTSVTLGGLCCVLPDFRRRGLFGALEARSIAAGGAPLQKRALSCGRMAHPGAFRLMARNATVVPKPGVTPTPWQREVGQAIADIYGVENFDPETFVCVGSGRPIGYPVIELETNEEEWDVFRHVDRARGDALLGIFWNPDAPEGW